MRSCTNNLKQIGLAMHNYHQTDDRFPQGHSASADQPSYSDRNYAGWTEWSAQAEMLQYMEGGSIYNAINFAFCGGYNYGRYERHGLETLITSFLCPSDNERRHGRPARTSAPTTRPTSTATAAAWAPRPRRAGTTGPVTEAASRTR